MIRSIKYILIPLLFFITFEKVFSQNDIMIECPIDSSLVGYEIPLQINIKDNTKQFQIGVFTFMEIAKVFMPKTDSLSRQSVFQNENINKGLSTERFEISDYGEWKANGENIIRNGNNTNNIKIKIWDDGQFAILPVIIENGDTIFPQKLFEYINNFGSSTAKPIDYPEITILATNSKNDTLQDIISNKGIMREEVSWLDYRYWIFGILGLLLVIIIFWYIINKKKETNQKEKKKVVEIIPAHVIALKKLTELKQNKPWLESTNIKEYQTKLTHILREYLENRYKIKALEQTTGEIIDSLSSFSIDENDNNTIKKILQIADLVKFAKAKVDENIHEKFLDDTIDFVNRTKEVKEIKND